jgi:RNA 2',3'-cyclic 3'-phosphodiesterase
VFLALWPDEGVRSALAVVTRRCLPRRGLRPVPPENLHLTLHFLGVLEASLLPRVVDATAGVAGVAFDLELVRLGFWPGPRVAWSAPRETPLALLGLVTDLGRALRGAGLIPDPRPFVAHVTLARRVVSPPARDVHPPVPWRVRGFVLVESRTLPEGARYQVLERFPLGPG